MRDTLLHQPMRFHVRHSRPLSLYNNILSISLIYSIIFTHLCTNILTLLLSVLPLLFLFGGLTNGKESEPNSSNGNGNGSSERNQGQKDAMSTSNRLPSPRVPSTSPISSGKTLKDKSGILFYFFNHPT